MAGLVSIEYLNSQKGVANGIAPLNGSAQIDPIYLPTEANDPYKGQYATSVLLIAAYPVGLIADYAWVTGTSSFWYWNAALVVPAWVNQSITSVAYALLTTAEKSAVPYIIIS
jgi:hypothetical protein